MNTIGAFVANVPKPIRDFVEGCAAAAITGAAIAVFVASGTDANVKQILAIALVGAINAVISYARRSLPAPQ